MMQWFSFQDRFWRKLPGTERSWHFGEINWTNILSKLLVNVLPIIGMSLNVSLSLSLLFFAQLDRHSLWHSNNSAEPTVSKQCPHWSPYSCRFSCRGRSCRNLWLLWISLWRNSWFMSGKGAILMPFSAIFNLQVLATACPGRRAQNTHRFFGGLHPGGTSEQVGRAL